MNNLAGLGTITADDLKFWNYWPRLQTYLADIQGKGQELLGYIAVYGELVRQEQAKGAGADQEVLGALTVAITELRLNYSAWADYNEQLQMWLPAFMQVAEAGPPQSGVSGLGALPVAIALGVAGIAAIVYIVETHEKVAASTAAMTQLTQAYINGDIDSTQYNSAIEQAQQAVPAPTGLDLFISKLGDSVGTILTVGAIGITAWFLVPKLLAKGA